MNMHTVPAKAGRRTNQDERQEEELLRAHRREEDVRRVRGTALRSFSAALLQDLAPQFEPGHGGFPPSMHFAWRGVSIRLSWGQFLWAEPGQADYFEGRHPDGSAVQFTPYFKGNDERLLQLIESYRSQRTWWRKLLDVS